MPTFLYNPEYLDQSPAEANALWASEKCLLLYNPECPDQSPAEANTLWASEECLAFYITQNILIRVLQKLMPSELVKNA